MTSLKRNLCLLLMLILSAPGMVYPVYAEEVTAAPVEEATASSTADTNSSGQTSEVTAATSTASELTATSQTDVDSQSASATTSSATTEQVTEVHEARLGGGGADPVPSSDTASTTEAVATSSPPTDGPGIPLDPILSGGVVTSTPVDSRATTSSNTEATSTTILDTPVAPATTTEMGTTTIISTGDATASANLLNILNSTFVNSSGAIALSNFFDPVTGTLDLRNASSSIFGTGGICQAFACTGGAGVSVNLSSDAFIINSLFVSALSGNNQIATTTNALISTGNAFAGLNLVNLANLNVVDSIYLLAAINAFQGMSGDIVFPSLSGFFDSLFPGVPGTVNLTSTADVENEIGVAADSGGNTLASTTSGSITSGAARTIGNVLNILNSNRVGGADLSVLLRVQGTWNGQVYGLPEGYSFTSLGGGNYYLARTGVGGALAGDSNLTASSSASIRNLVGVSALSGGNSISNAANGVIVTGDALAGANILNIANQNIIGRNWLMAIVNIFGNLDGNIAFGRPDLWVGAAAQAPATIAKGSTINYQFTIKNTGDSPASHTTFTARIPASLLTVPDDTSGTYTKNSDGSIVWEVGPLAPAQSIVVSFTGVVEQGTADITVSGAATEHETDNNLTDNTDSVTITPTPQSHGSGSSSASALVTKKLESGGVNQEGITVQRSTPLVDTGFSRKLVHEELTVTNPTNATSSPYDLHDLLADPSGTVIGDQSWPLGTIAPHEEVHITYDIEFSADAPAGTYSLTTVLASDEAGDVRFADNGAIVLAALPLARTDSGSTSHPIVHVGTVERLSDPTPLVQGAVKESSSLPAAALLAGVPLQTVIELVLAACLFALLSLGVLRLRRRVLGE